MSVYYVHCPDHVTPIQPRDAGNAECIYVHLSNNNACASRAISHPKGIGNVIIVLRECLKYYSHLFLLKETFMGWEDVYETRAMKSLPKSN